MGIIVILLLVVLFVTFMTIKVIKRLFTRWDRSPTCLTGKTVIVTGANTGIGYFTAQDFAKRGAKVILACRNKENAQLAKANLVKATENSNIVVRMLDLASLTSVREFAKEIIATEDRLDVLVNNAGSGWLDDTKSEDGLNLLLQINYFGPFLLTNLLIDLLRKSAPSRIVNVSSSTVVLAKLNPQDLNAFPEGRLGKLTNYSNSKLLNIMFSNELARRLTGTGVTANSLHPGAVYTNLFQGFPNIFRQFFLASARLFFRTAEEGAQTSIYMSVSKDLENISGEYFDNCHKACFPAMPEIAKDEQLLKAVWEKSEELINSAIKEEK